MFEATFWRTPQANVRARTLRSGGSHCQAGFDGLPTAAASLRKRRENTWLQSMRTPSCGDFRRFPSAGISPDLEAWHSALFVQKSDMFSANKLTPEQKDSLKQWAAEGATMSDLQRHLKEDFGHTITYMDTRFLILDLGIELIEEPKVEPKKEEKPVLVPTGFVTTTMDSLTLPGALVSGKVTFSDGETGVWMLDQTGRPGLDPDTEGYRPTPEDIKEFQVQLRDLIQKSGL